MKRAPLSVLACGIAISLACNRTAPSEPALPTPADAGPDTGAKVLSLQDLLAHPGEHPDPPPPPTDADFVKVGSREPGWDLDPGDPARDYVERYLLSTQRYGKETACIHAEPSRIEGGRTLVEARDGAGDGCNGTRAVRDVFVVDVPRNHMELADPARGQPLGDWPDGSGTEALPGAEPKEGPPMESWDTGLRRVLKALDLVPLRVQFYGRGSYPVISLAGWYGTVTPAASQAQLTAAARRICVGSRQFPLGLIITRDRTRILRIHCPDGARWETL